MAGPFRRVRFWFIAHAVDDFYQGLVPAVIPFLAMERGYDHTALAALALAAALGSSVPQPFFGVLSDRRALPWIAPLGLSAAGIAACAATIPTSFPLSWSLFLVSGIGVAAFHPAAGRDARRDAAGSVTSMSYFATGGKVGFFLAPIVVTPLAVAFGLHALLALAPVAPLVGTALLRYQTRTPDRVRAPRTHPDGLDRWQPFLTLTAVEILRSAVTFGISTFLALFFVEHHHVDRAVGGVALALFFGGGVAGALAGGRIADRFGTVRTAKLGGMLVIPALLALRFSPNPALGLFWAFVTGVALNITFAVLITLGQDYLPNRPATASGVTLGLAVSAGGLFVPVLGVLADEHGVAAALTVLCLLPLPAVALCLLLPDPSKPTAERVH